MNKHLSKYLTHTNNNLRNWVKKRFGMDQRYNVIEGNINYIPGENIYVLGCINLVRKRLKKINADIIYCTHLRCNYNELTSLPELLFCEKLSCQDNKLTSLPELPVCKRLICHHNKLTKLPDLPACIYLDCSNNDLTSLPDLPLRGFLCSASNFLLNR